MFSSFCSDDNVICFGKYCNPNLRYYIHQSLTRIQLTGSHTCFCFSLVQPDTRPRRSFTETAECLVERD